MFVFCVLYLANSRVVIAYMYMKLALKYKEEEQEQEKKNKKNKKKKKTKNNNNKKIQFSNFTEVHGDGEMSERMTCEVIRRYIAK